MKGRSILLNILRIPFLGLIELKFDLFTKKYLLWIISVAITKSVARESQNEEALITELNNKIECPRCNDVMELNSKFET